jgi:hypothetical protein
LNLSLELAHERGYQAAVEADQEVWDQVEPDTWYWIPQTPFVAVSCEEDPPAGNDSETCILDDGTSHGTGTTSSVLKAHEDALIAFKQGGPDVQPFLDGDIPVDVFSVSWGTAIPVPFSRPVEDIYVTSTGNDARPMPADGWAANPQAIAVGGGYPDGSTPAGVSEGQEELLAGKFPDVVSHFCRSLAEAEQTDGYGRSCGTSFAAPTVAGALSKAILEVRETSGYAGPLLNGFVDPELGITIDELREAMNRTASYDPAGPGEEPVAGVPLNPVAPWLQWGWGFYSGDQADATAEHLVAETQPPKPETARLYMHTLYDARQIYATDEPSYAPEAHFTADCVGATCSFDATDSSDEQVDDEDLTYEWQLGDGTTARGPIVEHTYRQAGGHDVQLTVSDGSRNDTAEQRIHAIPGAELDAQPTKDRYAVDDPVAIQLELATEEGEGVGGVPIRVETTYRTGNFWADTAVTATVVQQTLRTADLIDHERVVETDDDGRALVEIPGAVDQTGQRANAPTPVGEYAYTAEVDVDQVFEGDAGTYAVGPSLD